MRFFQARAFLFLREFSRLPNADGDEDVRGRGRHVRFLFRCVCLFPCRAGSVDSRKAPYKNARNLVERNLQHMGIKRNVREKKRTLIHPPRHDNDARGASRRDTLHDAIEKKRCHARKEEKTRAAAPHVRFRLAGLLLEPSPRSHRDAHSQIWLSAGARGPRAVPRGESLDARRGGRDGA